MYIFLCGHNFKSVGHILLIRNTIAWLYFKCTFSFISNCHIVFQRSYSNLYSHQHCRSIPSALWSSPKTDIVLHMFLNLVHLTCVLVTHFNFIFANEQKYLIYLHIFICHLYVFFGEMPVRSFCSFSFFLNRVASFLNAYFFKISLKILYFSTLLYRVNFEFCGKHAMTNFNFKGN